MKKNNTILVLILIMFLLTGCLGWGTTNTINNEEVLLNEMILDKTKVPYKESLPDESIALIRNYTKENYSAINIEDLRRGEYHKLFDLFKNELDIHDVYFLGEGHRMDLSTEIMLPLFKYLHEHGEVRYLLLEISVSEGKLLDRYLQTGEEELLSVYFRLKDASFRTEAEYIFLKELYGFNKCLPEDDKVRVFGLDIEMSLNYTYYYINLLIPNYDPPEEIVYMINELKKNPVYHSGLLAENIRQHEEAYRQYFGSNYNDLMEVVNNAVASSEAKQQPVMAYHRDKVMYNNFIQVWENYPRHKFFGQFGRNHTYLMDAKVGIVDPLAPSLNDRDDSPVKDKVFTISAFYSEYSNHPYYHRLENSNYWAMGEVTDKNYNLFRVYGDTSPYQYMTIPFQTNSDLKIGEASQYILYLLGSKKLSPMSEDFFQEYIGSGD